MDTEKINRLAAHITETIEALQADHKPKQWNPLAGQWIVYGLERTFGFGGAAELESIVERAWRKGQPIKPLIETWLKER